MNERTGVKILTAEWVSAITSRWWTQELHHRSFNSLGIKVFTIVNFVCRHSDSSRTSYLSVAQLTRDSLPTSHEYLRATLPSAHTLHQFMSHRSVANFPDAREVLAAKAEPMPENQTTYEQATFIETTTPEPASINRWVPFLLPENDIKER